VRDTVDVASNGLIAGSAAAGAVDGNSFVTWLVPGSRFGNLGN